MVNDSYESIEHHESDGENERADFWHRLSSTNGSGPFMRWTAFFMFVVVIILGLLGYQVEQRNEVIEETRAAAQRIEQAATHTEQVLVDIVEEQNSPEQLAQNEAVRDALREISEIKRAVCMLPEVTETPECE